MKHNWIRLLSLTLLLTLLAGAVPALAAAKPAIEKPDVFWQGDWQRNGPGTCTPSRPAAARSRSSTS